ncbi:hypothetical protein HK101_008611 [Irineochytrium annulatum]|nr:hypothetical protein HK101_008611 [Irineochytrium annulatum]
MQSVIARLIARLRPRGPPPPYARRIRVNGPHTIPRTLSAALPLAAVTAALLLPPTPNLACDAPTPKKWSDVGLDAATPPSTRWAGRDDPPLPVESPNAPPPTLTPAAAARATQRARDLADEIRRGVAYDDEDPIAPGVLMQAANLCVLDGNVEDAGVLLGYLVKLIKANAAKPVVVVGREAALKGVEPKPRVSAAALGPALDLLSTCMERQGKLADAADVRRELVELDRRVLSGSEGDKGKNGAPPGAAARLAAHVMSLAGLEYRLGRHESALKLGEEAFALVTGKIGAAGEVKDERARMESLGRALAIVEVMARCRVGMGDYAEARKLYERLLGMVRDVEAARAARRGAGSDAISEGGARELARLMGELAGVEEAMGEYGSARRRLAESLVMQAGGPGGEGTGSSGGVRTVTVDSARTLTRLGRVMCKGGDVSSGIEALRDGERQMEVARGTAAHPEVAESLFWLGYWQAVRDRQLSGEQSARKSEGRRRCVDALTALRRMAGDVKGQHREQARVELEALLKAWADAFPKDPLEKRGWLW